MRFTKYIIYSDIFVNVYTFAKVINKQEARRNKDNGV